MKIELNEIAVREVFNGYRDSAEESAFRRVVYRLDDDFSIGDTIKQPFNRGGWPDGSPMG